MKQFIFWAMAARGEGISGSDRIFIELAKRWSINHRVKIMVWTEGYQMGQRSNLVGPHLKYSVSDLSFWTSFGFVGSYLGQILMGIWLGLTLKVPNRASVISYSASDFWMDVFPSLIIKLRYPKTRWLASWYQTAPSPWQGFGQGRVSAYRWSAWWYWLMQLPVKPLISHWADWVIVNNEDERQRFSKLNKQGRVFVMIGAVDVGRIKQYRKQHPRSKSREQVVFQGRFHPQKGVVELVQIWAKVVRARAKAKLVMIGDGPLMMAVKEEIKRLRLGSKVELAGYVLDGDQKYKLFSQSRLVVHPAYYDSGGMAAAEAMAFDLPMVAFDLPAYQSYYPKGLVKASRANQKAFASAIVGLLKNRQQRVKLGQEAGRLIRRNYSWESRAKQLLDFLEQK